MMSKPMGALFGVLTLVAILAIAPSAFADSSATVNIAAGAGSGPDCSQSKTCFNPDTITIAPGTTVTWMNNDKVSHTVTSGNPSDNQTGTIFDSSLIPAGKQFTFTFNNPGTYNYFCQVHPWMTGEVIVSTSAAPTSSGSTASSSSGMNMSSGSMSNSTANMNTTMQSGQGQQNGIPLGSNYTAPANTPPPSAPTTPPPSAPTTPPPSAPTTPPPSSQAPQYGSQVPSTNESGAGQQGGIPLGSSYSSSGTQAAAPSPTESNPIGYTDQDNPYGPLQMPAWAAGLAIAAVMSGIGVWAAVRRR